MDISSINSLQMQSVAMQRSQAQGQGFEEALESAIAQGNSAEIRNAAIEMESFFINQMFQAMRRTVPEGEGMFEQSNAQRIWQEMLDEETSINLARAGGLGLADVLYEQLTRAVRG
ncbi:MAG: rod-binding protein [Defluviitaleaceae bacterium]|nr:rod-binding protein [Defluviitaleaceae bacterium]